MSRAFIVVDETRPNAPVPELHANGGVLRMSERELIALIEDAQYALGHISGVRQAHRANLGKLYEVKL